MFDRMRTPNERLFSASGLAIVGLLLGQSHMKKALNSYKLKDNAMPQITNADVVFAYIGLLCQGKPDFDAIREMDLDPEFYKIALGLESIPSSETIRQRLDKAGGNWHQIIQEGNLSMLLNSPTLFSSRWGLKYVPLDIDAGSLDNVNTKRQKGPRAYKGFEDYAPVLAYLGEEGYLINLHLRGGSDRLPNNQGVFLKETLLQASQLTKAPILLRMDSGNDATAALVICYDPATWCQFIIRGNLQGESSENWYQLAQKEGRLIESGDGKKVYIGSTYRPVSGLGREIRMVYEVIERNSKADGQLFLVPEIEVSTWWTSLVESDKVIIDLYHAYEQCGQYRSELKNDMDLKRLPSGKFPTNQLILELTMLAYNILRLIGQQSLKRHETPTRRDILRRRIRTVIQNLV